MKERIEAILQKWFLTEPAVFAAVCSHRLTANPGMKCPVRCGGGELQYNPLYLNEVSQEAIEQLLFNEGVRILLKHPYQRVPAGCSPKAVATGSNLVIGDRFDGRSKNVYLEYPRDYELKEGMSYEHYSHEIQKRLPPEPPGGGSQGSDLSELWKEDPMMVATINDKIEKIKGWGSIPGSLADEIVASTRVKADWRKIVAGFRASVLSVDRCLTRMRPNRRTGFLQMGSKRNYSARILVAVDVSASVSDESLSNFAGYLNKAFDAGVFHIDVLQFDWEISKVESLSKKLRKMQIQGRGGTSFQEPVDYAFRNRYDGLLILTDGYAPEPVIPKGGGTKILWVCEDECSYEQNKDWMRKFGRVCQLELNGNQMPF